MKILIAEDGLVSGSFIKNFLEKYGECDLVVDGLEAIDAFLMALKGKEPFDLIYLDIMMPKLDGVKTLKAIRDLEKQYDIAVENRVKIIMTTSLADVQLVRTAFDYGCEVYAAKPIDTEKLIEVLEKLGLIEDSPSEDSINEPSEKVFYSEKSKNTSKQSMIKNDLPYTMPIEENKFIEGYFRSVYVKSDYQLEVIMETGTNIHFDFKSRLNSARFGMLRDKELFRSVSTDGNYLIFDKAGKMPVKISASEFMDLVLIDRRKCTYQETEP